MERVDVRPPPDEVRSVESDHALPVDGAQLSAVTVLIIRQLRRLHQLIARRVVADDN